MSRPVASVTGFGLPLQLTVFHLCQIVTLSAFSFEKFVTVCSLSLINLGRRRLTLFFKIFVGIFGVGLIVICLYWVFGAGKRQPQTIANILIYLWGFMLFGLMVSFANWLIR